MLSLFQVQREEKNASEMRGQLEKMTKQDRKTHTLFGNVLNRWGAEQKLHLLAMVTEGRLRAPFFGPSASPLGLRPPKSGRPTPNSPIALSDDPALGLQRNRLRSPKVGRGNSYRPGMEAERVELGSLTVNDADDSQR